MPCFWLVCARHTCNLTSHQLISSTPKINHRYFKTALQFLSSKRSGQPGGEWISFSKIMETKCTNANWTYLNFIFLIPTSSKLLPNNSDHCYAASQFSLFHPAHTGWVHNSHAHPAGKPHSQKPRNRRNTPSVSYRISYTDDSFYTSLVTDRDAFSKYLNTEFLFVGSLWLSEEEKDLANFASCLKASCLRPKDLKLYWKQSRTRLLYW